MPQLTLLPENTIPVQMGPHTYLEYRPPVRPLGIVFPQGGVHTPNFRSAYWYRYGRHYAWFTSHLLAEPTLQWFNKCYGGTPPELQVYLQEVQELEEQIHNCRTETYQELDLDRSEIGIDPFPFQINGIWFMLLRKRALLADQVGMGKTAQYALAWKQGKKLGLLNRALIAVPKSILYQVQKEFEKTALQQVQIFNETTPIPEVLEQLSRLPGPYQLPPVVAITHHRLRDTIASHPSLGARLGKAFDVLILDEAQVIKNRTSDMSRALRTIATPYLWMATATPVENNLEEAHTLCQFLDPLLFGSWSYFAERYCKLDIFKRITGYRQPEELKAKIDSVTLRRERKTHKLPMPEVQHLCFPVEMAPAQRQLYESFVQQTGEALELYAASKGQEHSQIALQVLQLYTVLRIICDCPALVDPSCTESAKVDWLKKSLLEKKSCSWVVYSQWKRVVDFVIEELQGVPSLQIFQVHGGMTTKKRNVEIERFKASSFPRSILICTDAAKCGLNLQTADTLINLERHFNPAVDEQRAGRINRLGSSGKKTVITLYTQKTVEEKIEQMVQKKRKLANEMFSMTPPLEFIAEVLKTQW